MRTLLEVGSLDNVDAFVDRSMGEKRRLMASGTRLHRGRPARAILKGLAEAACRQSGQALWYDLAVALHAKVQATKRLIPTWTSTRRPSSTRSGFRWISSPRSSRRLASPAGPPTCSSSTTKPPDPPAPTTRATPAALRPLEKR